MTELRLLILGLLDRQARSAYAVGQALGQMPAANFSGSPGAVYPAVRAMQREGLISRRTPPSGVARGQALTLTNRGRDALHAWLEDPVDPWDLVRVPGSILLRLSFLPDESARAHFKRQIECAARELIAELDRYTKAASPDLGASSAEGLALTRALLHSYLNWVQPLDRDGNAI